MIEEIKNIKSEKSDFRKFGITVGIILIIVGGFLYWKEKESFQILLTAGVVLLILGLTIPVILKPIYWVWMIFATIIGWFMTKLILSLLFYVILTPIGLIPRLIGKQFIGLKWNKKYSTYWNYRSGVVFEQERCEKQF
jgi:multisubunit Na+/H+ antiporter MnhG subunit|tara:strand:+ start:6 stop:419 length:414 start_codon:yes stop_codon:yes gene_type:complete